MNHNIEELLLEKIKVLNETIWEDKASQPSIDEWLNNFNTSKEKIHALYLLSKFMYFGSLQIRVLLKALYSDLYKYPIIHSIRQKNSDTIDLNLINNSFYEELGKTRFLGMGNPSESGCHLLYYFRQENGLPKDLFIHGHEIFVRDICNQKICFKDNNIKRYVFIDDFCGSGQQATSYSESIIHDIKSINPLIEVYYFTLFATKHGLETVRTCNNFNKVESVLILDDSFKCFELNSRYFSENYNDIDKNFAKQMCFSYGCKMNGTGHELGYKDGQLLIGFEHNTPDNTLPIIWFNEKNFNWQPIFKRYNKV